MSIQDLYGNAVSGGGTSGEMLAFTNPEPEETLGLLIYDFFIEPIRLQDAQNGNLFLKRFLEGMQQQWQATQARLFDVKNLWSLTKCPDDLLRFLKSILGWTSELDHITDALDVVTLRRLMANSVPFWRERGPEDTISDILRVMTGARVRVLNWFQMRALVGESGIAEERRGTDLMGLSRPGEGTRDDMWMSIRIVDDGTLNHQLVKDTCALMRPVGERFEIVYVRFLDLFDVAGDNSQWLTTDASPMLVEDGLLKLTSAAAESAIIDVEGSTDFAEYVFTARFKATASASGEEVGFFIYYGDANNFYRVVIDPVLNTLTVEQKLAGVLSDFAGPYNLTQLGYRFPQDVWCAIRLAVFYDSGFSNLQIYLDGMLVDVVPILFVVGSAGIYHSANATITCSDVEVMQSPVTVETIEINPT